MHDANLGKQLLATTILPLNAMLIVRIYTNGWRSASQTTSHCRRTRLPTETRVTFPQLRAR